MEFIYPTGPVPNDSFPMGQCYNWCKDGKCKFADQANCNFEHTDEHKGKFPNAAMPRKR